MLTLLTPRGPRPFEAALFDMDGTMIDTRAMHNESWRLTLEGRNPAPDWQETLHRTFGMQGKAILPSLLGRNVPPGEMEELLFLKEDTYRRMAPGRIRPIPGLEAFIRRAHHAGVRMALATSAVAVNVDLALNELGLRAYFSSIVTKERTRFSKPHPETFLIAANELYARPSLCVVFEDAPAGVEGAARGGMIPVAIETCPHEELGRWAEVRVKDFAGVLERIR